MERERPTRRTGRHAARAGNGRGHDAPVPGTAADLTPDADQESVARAIALRQLTLSARSRAQLAEAMAKRDVPQEVADRVLDRFEEVGLVDDQDFARQWVQTRHAGRGLSRRALSHELRSKGVDDETAQEAVDEIDDEDELEAARALVRRRLPSMLADDPARRVRRLSGMLARRGYGSSLAMRVIREVTGEQEEFRGD